MSFRVDPEWWKSLFDELYLVTDARSVLDDEITRREIDILLELIPLSPGEAILDFCGGHGRHSIELYSRGFQNCTVLDYSEYLIDRGRAEAGKLGMEINFLTGDARNTGLAPASFDHVMVLGNSLGYLPSPDGDREILIEAMRLLRAGGCLTIDIVNGAALREKFNPVAWHEIGDDIVVCRERTLTGDLVLTREMVLSKEKGMLKDSCYSLHLYDTASVESLVSSLGFSRVKVITDFSPFRKKGDFGFMNWRMLVTCRKP